MKKREGRAEESIYGDEGEVSTETRERRETSLNQITVPYLSFPSYQFTFDVTFVYPP